MNALVPVAALAALLPAAASHAQEQPSTTPPMKLEATLLAAFDEAEKALVAGAIDLTRDLGSYFRSGGTSPPLSENPSGDCSRSVQSVKVAPDIDIFAGQNGTFQRIVVKAEGAVLVHSAERASDAGLPLEVDRCVADFDKPLHLFPMSLGVETTRYFNTTAVLGEVGYVPFVFKDFGSAFGQELQLGINPVLGVFLQGGYKFGHTDASLTGGSKDESGESPNTAILRLKADVRATLKLPTITLVGSEITPMVMPWATGWYDIANNDFHYSVGTTLRLPFPSASDRYFDFTVAQGSGEPSFNTGAQFSAGLTIAY